jgi:hypothetical protein
MKNHSKKAIIKTFQTFFSCLFLFGILSVQAQVSSVSVIQGLNFGTFHADHGGGNITINPAGERSFTGNFILINQGRYYSAATIEIEAVEGTVINIITPQNVELTGSNGGSMNLQIGESDRGDSFIMDGNPSGKTLINIGGRLKLGSSNTRPPGKYSGEFYIMFSYE